MSDAATIRGHKIVELVKPTPPFRDGDYFDRGERAIMVDGARWGRTHMKWHGRNGCTVTFSQEAGEILLHDPTIKKHARFARELSIRSMHRRHEKRRWIEGRYVDNPDFKSTEELALEKARELVDTGRLRDPIMVRAEQAAASERWRRSQAAAAKALDAEFLQRAMEAVRANDPDSDIVKRVVEVMRWAQNK